MLIPKHKQDSQRRKPVWSIASFDLRALSGDRSGKAREPQLEQHPLVQFSFLTPSEHT
jgi:hypothetical protein